MLHKPTSLYRPPAPVPTTPIRALVRGMLSAERDMLSLMPASAYDDMITSVGWTRRGVVLVNDPAAVSAILGRESPTFPKNDLMVGALVPLVGDSVFVSSGVNWERQRRMIDPAFGHMRVTRAFDAMELSVDAYEGVMDQRADTGEVFSLEEAMSHLTADIICRTIFSRSLETDAARKIYENFAVFQDNVANVQVFRLWMGKAWDEVQQPEVTVRAAREIRHYIGQLLDDRAEEGGGDDIAADIMSARDPLDGSGFSREELIDQIGVFFLAGHETTAGALAWAFFILSQQPEMVSRMRAEIAAVRQDHGGRLNADAVKKLELVRNVFRETLRLYPPLGFIPRVALEPGRLGDVSYPKGAMILISPWLIHRHNRLWADADRFDPDRFSGQAEASRPAGAYLPFGLGPRICVGAAFALIEATLILARVVERYEIEAADPSTVRPAARLTTRAADDIRVRIRPRTA